VLTKSEQLEYDRILHSLDETDGALPRDSRSRLFTLEFKRLPCRALVDIAYEAGPVALARQHALEAARVASGLPAISEAERTFHARQDG